MNTSLLNILSSELGDPSEPIKVYCAGKMREECWRLKLVPELQEHHWSLGHLPQAHFIYVGPFFVRCNHGCNQQPNSHGNDLGCWPDRDADKQEVGRLCREAISNADLVFCFIDSLDCYGTIAEIERANTLGKPVVIAFAHGIATEDNNEMWFVCTLAARVHYNVCECKLPGLLNAAIEEMLW